MQLNKDQLSILARYFADLSKILIASTVIGFFVSSSAAYITAPVFMGGSVIALAFVIFSLNLLK